MRDCKVPVAFNESIVKQKKVQNEVGLAGKASNEPVRSLELDIDQTHRVVSQTTVRNL
jgi:hypothetical protein